MKHIYITIIVILSCSTFMYAQEGEKQLKSISGPAGNYIYAISYEDLQEIPDFLTFEITRAELTDINGTITYGKYKTIGTLAKATEISEIKNIIGGKDLDSLRSAFNLTTDKEVVEVFQYTDAVSNPLTMIYPLIEVKQALAHVYLDAEAKKGVIYSYKLIKLDADGNKSTWGTANCKRGAGNYTLKTYEPKFHHMGAKETSIEVQYDLALTEEIFNQIPLNEHNSDQALNKELNELPFPYLDVRAQLEIKRGDRWEEEIGVYGSLNESEDSLSYRFKVFDIIEDSVLVRIKIVDEVGNVGNVSPGLWIYTVDKGSIPSITGLQVIDTLNGVHIKWDKIPQRGYYTGIEILRTDGDDNIDTLALLPITDTRYFDYNMEIGKIYNYSIQPKLVDQKGLKANLPTKAAGTIKRFTKPLPPTDLVAENEGRDIRLNWKGINEKSIYGYYIYRGTHPKTQGLIAGPVQNATTFLDTSSHLSGFTEYYYSVVTGNYTQDTSIHSNLVNIKPDRRAIVDYPANISCYHANDTLYVMWDELRKDNPYISGYKVQRKLEGEQDFKNIHEGIISQALFKDNVIVKDKSYEYRVAGVNIEGEVSEYSEPTAFTFIAARLYRTDAFSLRNVSDGIKLTLPKANVNNRESYTVYRRSIEDVDFKKITSIAKGQFDFLDKDVKENQKYVYAITYISNKGEESPRSLAKTITKEKFIN